MDHEVRSIEKEAHRLLDEHQYHEAAELFYRVANSYKKFSQHRAAAMCLASAASCWALQAGEQTFYNASRDYERAAQEAEKSKDWEYTALLYKHAAVCHERDKEYLGFSECYFKSKEFYIKYLAQCIFRKENLFNPRKWFSRELSKQIVEFSVLLFSSLMWGHGERPFRTVVFGAAFILVIAVMYMPGHFIKEGTPGHINLGEAIYFSMVTFLTVGYGDLVPVGLSRWVAVWESFCGLFIFPIFITALCRKYLRE